MEFKNLMDRDYKICSIGDLFLEIGNLIKNYERNRLVSDDKKETSPMYDINEVIENYPQLSKHLITKYINEGLIPVTRIGNHRYFYKNDIEDLLKAKIESKEKTNTYTSWRNNE